MEAAFLWVWGDSLPYWYGALSNRFNQLEQDMLESFRSLGREDLVRAFMSRHKYSRTMRTVTPPVLVDYGSLWFRREAFLGEGAGKRPQSNDEWIAMARERYGEDEGFKRYMARIEAEAAEVSDSAGDSGSKER